MLFYKLLTESIVNDEIVVFIIHITWACAQSTQGWHTLLMHKKMVYFLLPMLYACYNFIFVLMYWICLI